LVYPVVYLKKGKGELVMKIVVLTVPKIFRGMLKKIFKMDD